MRILRSLLLLLIVALAGGEAVSAAPKLVYSSLEAEAASEYQVGWQRFGPSYVKLIGSAEFALTEDLTAKAVVSPCVGPYSKEPEGVTECSRYRLIEQLTLGGVGSGGDFSIGRQVITWGNTEGFVLLDRFNGRDLCRFVRLDIQNKLPNWIARGRTFLGESTTFSVNFAPLSGKSEPPHPDSYCAEQFYLDDPNNDGITDWAGGAELAVTHDIWSATLNVMSTREDLVVLETVPVPEKTRPRTLWLGGTVSATLGGIVVRGELAFSPERTFTIAPEATGNLLMQGIATNGADERWDLLTAVGMEMRKEDWYWVLQYFHDRVENGPPLALEEKSLMSLRVRRTFANDRLAFDSFSILDLDHRDFALRASVSYEIDKDMTVEVGGTGYLDFGDDSGGLFSGYQGRESLFVKVRRTLF